MAQLTNTLINGDLRVTGTIYGSHTHGNITNGGTLQTTDVTIASGDKLVITDSSDSSKVARASISFDGSTATKALTQKGTWETFNSKIDAAASTANENYKLLAAAAAPSTGTTNTTAVYDADVTLNPSTNTISANISGKASLLAGTYSGNGGQLAPSAITKGTVRAAMMNAPKGLTAFNTYCDCILMDTYTGTDVPYVTGLGISRNNGKPKMYIFNGAQGNTTTWANEQEVYTTATTVAIANGGTGATDAATARSNLDVYSTGQVDTAISGKADLANTSQTVLEEPFQDNANYLIVSQTTFGGSSSSAWLNYDLSMIIQSRHSGTGLAVIQCNVNTATPTETSLTGTINIFTTNSANRIDSPLTMYRKYDANTYKWTVTVVAYCSDYNNFTIKSILSRNGLNYSTSCSYVTVADLTTLGTRIAEAVTTAPAIASQTSFDIPLVLGSVRGIPQASSYLRYYSDSNNGHILTLGDSEVPTKYSNNYSRFQFNRGIQKYTELRSANTSSTSNVLYLPTNPGRLEVTLSNQFSYNSSTQWYKLAEIAASGDSNASCLNIKGMCGGYQANAQHEFSLAIGVRGSVGFDYTVLSGTHNNIIKFVLAKNTDNSYTLYIRVDAGQYGKFALTAIPGPNVSMVYDGTSVAFSGTAVADSGTDTYKKYAIRSSSSTLAIANGGTGATDAATARSNLGVAASIHNHSADNITSGMLAVARGGLPRYSLGVTHENPWRKVCTMSVGTWDSAEVALDVYNRGYAGTTMACMYYGRLIARIYRGSDTAQYGTYRDLWVDNGMYAAPEAWNAAIVYTGWGDMELFIRCGWNTPNVQYNVQYVHNCTVGDPIGDPMSDSEMSTYLSGKNYKNPTYSVAPNGTYSNMTVGKITDRTNTDRYVQVSYYGSGTITGSNNLTHLAGFFKPDGDSSSVICDVTPAKLAAYLSGSDVNVALQNGTYTNMTVGKANKVGNYSIVVGALGTDTSTLYFV